MSSRARSSLEGAAALVWLFGIPAIAFGGMYLVGWLFWNFAPPPDSHPILFPVLLWSTLVPAFLWGRYGWAWLNRLLERMP